MKEFTTPKTVQPTNVDSNVYDGRKMAHKLYFNFLFALILGYGSFQSLVMVRINFLHPRISALGRQHSFGNNPCSTLYESFKISFLRFGDQN